MWVHAVFSSVYEWTNLSIENLTTFLIQNMSLEIEKVYESKAILGYDNEQIIFQDYKLSFFLLHIPILA